MERLWDEHAFLQGRARAARVQHRDQRESDHAGHRGRQREGQCCCRTGCSSDGVFAQAIAFPTVARDKARVRTIVTATHTREDLQYALDAFAKVGREIGLI